MVYLLAKTKIMRSNGTFEYSLKQNVFTLDQLYELNLLLSEPFISTKIDSNVVLHVFELRTN